MIDTTCDRQLTCVRFSCRVNENNVDRLKRGVEKELSKGIKRFILLMNTKGGQWDFAFEAYEYLKKIRAEVTTHNYCHVWSSAIVIFCAGAQRTCTSRSVFRFHPTLVPAQAPNIPQKDIDLHDTRIARVIAKSCGQTEDDALRLIKGEPKFNVLERKKDYFKFNSEEALSFNLVHRIQDTPSTKGTREIQI